MPDAGRGRRPRGRATAAGAPGLAERVVRLAAERDLGGWLRSDRVNTRAESNWIVNTAPIAVIAVVGIGVLPFVSAIPWWARILLVAVCVVFALIGVLGTVHGIEQRRRGWWLVHRFAAGFVMERARGGIVATAYGEARAELMTYHEPGDSTSDGVDYVLLRLRFPDGGTWVMTEATHDAPDVLRELGERCGAGEPRAIEYRAALDLAIGREWV